MEVTKMKKVAIYLLIAASLGLAACSSSDPVVQEGPGDAAVAVKTAEDSAAAARERLVLEKQLEHADGDIGLLGKVWEDATAAKATDIADAANKALLGILKPKAEAAKRSSDILALKRQLPPSSPAYRELDTYDRKLLEAEMKAKQ